MYGNRFRYNRRADRHEGCHVNRYNNRYSNDKLFNTVNSIADKVGVELNPKGYSGKTSIFNQNAVADKVQRIEDVVILETFYVRKRMEIFQDTCSQNRERTDDGNLDQAEDQSFFAA